MKKLNIRFNAEAVEAKLDEMSKMGLGTRSEIARAAMEHGINRLKIIAEWDGADPARNLVEYINNVLKQQESNQ